MLTPPPPRASAHLQSTAGFYPFPVRGVGLGCRKKVGRLTRVPPCDKQVALQNKLAKRSATWSSLSPASKNLALGLFGPGGIEFAQEDQIRGLFKEFTPHPCLCYTRLVQVMHTRTERATLRKLRARKKLQSYTEGLKVLESPFRCKAQRYVQKAYRVRPPEIQKTILSPPLCCKWKMLY